MSWIIYAVISSLGFAGGALVLKQLTLFDIKVGVLNLYFWGMTAIFFLVFNITKRSDIKIPKESWKWFVLLAVITFLTNFAAVYAVKLAPNPGLVSAVQAASIIIVSVASIFLFDSVLSVRMIVGVISILMGVFFITM